MSYKKSLVPVDSVLFSKWYNDIIFQADMIDQSPVKGCVVIKPYGYAIWEHIVAELDKRIKATGTKNAYFPLFIPQSFLRREKDHLEGFSPELAVVTIAGGEELAEPYVVRPTSETVFYDMFSRWIKSYRDLPLKVNQWANVVRWEKRTRPFLRTTEFLWQEGHTAHRSFEEAHENMIVHLELYKNFYRDYLCLSVVTGPKPESEKFAGAHTTMTLEALMPDGKALQLGTSHLLTNDFPKVFGVAFQDADGTTKTPWCTSWGTTTRMIGALVMAHGDEKGLVLPPKVAPIQALIVPIFKTEEQKGEVLAYCSKVQKMLLDLGIRCEVDADTEKTPGFKFAQAEQKGIPVRIEAGPMDIAKNGAMVVPRITLDGVERKTFVALDSLADRVGQLLEKIGQMLLAQNTEFVAKNTHNVESVESLASALETQRGFFRASWCDRKGCLDKLKEMKATPRVVVEKVERVCINCKEGTVADILVATSY